MAGHPKPIGDLEELVLLAVLRLGDQAYGASIREELKDQASRSVSISTVYVTLMRMEEKGLSRSWMGQPSGERGGKAKRHFQVSAEGLEALEASRVVRERMWARADQGGEAHAG